MRLNYLYLLTVADIKGTNPKLWNSWRAALLRKLYESTLGYLRAGQQPATDSSALIEDAKQSSLRLLTERNFQTEEIESFWSELEDDYFLRHTDEEIAWHMGIVLSDHDHDRAHINIRQKTTRGCTEIFIYSRDRSYLFAHITECLTLAGLSVHEARIITSKKGHALDTFLVLDHEGKPIQDSDQCTQLQTHIEAALESNETAANFTNHHIPRRLKHFWITPQVHFQKESERGHTVIEVLATDYPGLLANLAQVFADFSISIHNARISTLGERAHDFFYVTDQHQQALTDPELRQQLKNRLIERIGQYNTDANQAIVI